MSPPPISASLECRQRIVEAARDEFMRDGFRGASVDRIAATAGVAKQTLYNHFPSKEALFAETIRAGVQGVVVTLDQSGGDLRQCLLDYGLAFRTKLLGQEGLAWFRTFIGDLSRIPELGRIALREGPLETIRQLADFLKAAMQRGDLRADDPEFAAEMLNGMLINLDRTRGLFADDGQVSGDPNKVQRIVDLFLRAYRPE
jgi:TetR/AcrR family transcriptional repressor of mexJK operon